VGFLAFNNDWGRNLVPNFKEQFEKFNLKTVFEEYYDAGTVDLMPLFSRAKAKGVKALVLNGDTLTMSILTKQSYEAGMGGIPRVLATGGNMTQIIANAGKEAAEGVLQVEYYHPNVETPGNKEMTALWWKKYPDQIPYQAQASGYSQVKVIAKAIEMAKSDKPEAIRDALEKVQVDTPFGLTKFDKFHQATPFHVINRAKDGKPVLVWWSGR
jgi:ABC-type branched-subunit amino acid transport system substrate-binding protein